MFNVPNSKWIPRSLEVEKYKGRSIFNAKAGGGGNLNISVCVLVAQSCPTLCDPMDYSPPGSSVHGILQARKPEWIAIPFSRGSSRPRDQTHISCVSCIAGRFFTTWELKEFWSGYRKNKCKGKKWTTIHIKPFGHSGHLLLLLICKDPFSATLITDITQGLTLDRGERYR